ncbi:hypothetical protein AgCh_009373 [Apium graveolens]
MALSVVNAVCVLSRVGCGQFKSKQKCIYWGTPSLERNTKSSNFSGTRKAGGISESVVVDNDKEDDKSRTTLEPLWDDGHGTATIKDFLDLAVYNINSDQLQWFCPIECGCPLPNSPILFYLPGIDGLGSGLVLHHKPLGRVFEVWCLHIPFHDRTPFEGLVKFVESTIKLQHYAYSHKPIYIVGDSFGGCISLAVAANNPSIDLVLILVNPATSFKKSPLQWLLSIAEPFENEFETIVPYILSMVLGDPLKAGMVNIKSGWHIRDVFGIFFKNITDVMPSIQVLADNIPRGTFQWKLNLQKASDFYLKSRLHTIKAEVLLLASGQDSLFSSKSDAERLSSIVPDCTIRYFQDSRHNLLMEDDINLLTIIKGTCKYRRSRRKDWVSDFLPPSISEYNYTFFKTYGIVRHITSPAMFSTLENGNIVRGLDGVPREGPILLVGSHMLLGTEISSLVQEFLREKNIMVHGMAYREIFSSRFEDTSKLFSILDTLKVFGALPVTTRNICKLFSNKSHVLLYPGGIREALRRKGEHHKLFWPDKPEFVRIAAKFGVTIIPFGVVGEDDMVELLPHDNEQTKTHNSIKFRSEKDGEVSYENLFFPNIYPKIPGRYYFLFGKPIETKGKAFLLEESEYRKRFYMQIKSEVEQSISYLLKKREEDPYRGLLERTLYRAFSASKDYNVPSFDP